MRIIMPSQPDSMDDSGNLDSELRLKVIYSGQILITYVKTSITYEDFCSEIRDICTFDSTQPFTVKWVDEEGDPCTISSQLELDEAVRLYNVNADSEMTLHIFPNVPEKPGLPNAGEDRNMYRRGARRWRKLYRVNGHLFQAKRFNRRAFCAYCSDRIWGLGRQGYKCMTCKLLVHKKCHKMVTFSCQGPNAAENVSGGEAHRTSSLPVLKGHTRPQQSTEDTSLAGGDASLGQEVGKETCAEDLTKHESVDDLTVITQEENAQVEPVQPTGNDKAIGLKDFELLRVIGRGSYAKVLMVEQKKTKRVYAMKVIKKEQFNEDEDIDWVQTEKHVFETASNHPFLVGLHSCFQTPSRLFFVIEFVNGGDLMFHMQRQRRLPEEHARFYSAEISSGLNYLHERGIIYRDLKLDNVLLDSEGHIKLTDYGMCKEKTYPGEKTNTFCGTPNYIAPEILRGEAYDNSVDWWALGVLMFEMLAGRSPFDIVGSAENPDQNTEDYLFQVILEKTIRIPRSVSVKAASVLKGFLNKDPLERLGCHPQTGYADIQSHPFFRTIDWELLEQRQITPPYKVPVKSDRDLEHFDPQFTNEPIQLTPDDPKTISKIDQSEFEGFEYINPLLMSMEDCV